MFAMSVPAPAQEVSTLRMSRVAILARLIAFAQQRKERLFRDVHFGLWLRLWHWMRLAIALQSRIKRGAFDTLRKPRAPRLEYERFDLDLDLGLDFDLDDFDDDVEEDYGEGHPRPVKSYLDLPFGEVVALICEGIGMTPDWDAWACEPWAQEEIKTQPAGSPYVGYAPPKAALPPPQQWPTPAPQAIGLAAPPGLPAP
jgi:hypothetical protein